MAVRICPQCGAPVSHTAEECEYCGTYIGKVQNRNASDASSSQNTAGRASSGSPGGPQAWQGPYMTPEELRLYQLGINPAWPRRSKVLAALFAIFLGGLGIHWFYLGHVARGVVYLLFMWTGIPWIIGLCEGIYFLASGDIKFQRHYRVRLSRL